MTDKPDFEAEAAEYRRGNCKLSTLLRRMYDLGDAAGYARGVEDSANRCRDVALSSQCRTEREVIIADKCADRVRALSSKPGGGKTSEVRSPDCVREDFVAGRTSYPCECRECVREVLDRRARDIIR